MTKKIINLIIYFSSLAFMLWLIGFVVFSLYALSFKYSAEKHSDAVVVLTGGTNRIKTGLELMQKTDAGYMLISGVNKEVSQQELFPNVSKQDLNKITLGYEALDTVGNAQEIKSWVKGKNIKSILLVTSFYHMPRSVSEIKKVNKEIEIRPWTVFPKSFNQSVDWIKTRYAWLLFIEYHKYLFVQLKHLIRKE